MASSTSAVSTGSLNAVHQRARSALSAALVVSAGRSSCGGVGWTTAQLVSAIASANATGVLRMFASVTRMGRMAGCGDRRSRVKRVRMVDLRVQFVLRSRFGDPPLEDEPEEPRHEENREERRGEHASHDAGADRETGAGAG